MKMEKKTINSNSQTNYFSEPKLLFSDLAFILGNMESLGSDGLFFDLTHELFPLKAQGSTKAIYSCIWGAQLPSVAESIDNHLLCAISTYMFCLLKKETYILQPKRQPWYCLQSKDRVEEWAFPIFSS